MAREEMAVALDEEGATVDAATIAEGLGIDEAALRDLARRGLLTTRFERGVGEDEGRSRLTFRIEGRQLRLVIDTATGAVLHRFRTDFGSPQR